MPTPKAGYFTSDGTKVPSVTTIISRFKDSGALIYWAWDQGRKGLDYRQTKQSAADSGTIAHALVEAAIRGEECPISKDSVDPEVWHRGEVAFGAWQRWAEQTQLKAVASEVALVSETHGFGGTLDVVLVHGDLSIGDWKTANSLYPDNLLQLAAYGMLWNEHHPDEQVKGYHLMRFSKEFGDFSHHYFGDLTEAGEMFLHLRHAYGFDALIKRRAK